MFVSLILAVLALAYLFVPWPKLWRYIGAAIIVLGYWLIAWPSIMKDVELERAGWHTSGVVLRKDCERKNNQWVEYQFQVNGQSFTGKGTPGGGNVGCDGVQTGDQITVTYLVKDPQVNLPVREIKANIFLGTVLSLLIFVALVWVNQAHAGFVSEKRKRKKQ